MLNIFDRIDAWLAENNVSRRKLAIMAGLPPSSLQSALTRRKKLSYDTLDALSRAMGVTADSLLYGTTETDIAFEALEAELSEYKYSVLYDDNKNGWCYVYPSQYDDDPTFVITDEAKHLPVSFLESEIRSATNDGEKLKKQYVLNRIKNSIETADEIQLGWLWETGDM